MIKLIKRAQRKGLNSEQRSYLTNAKLLLNSFNVEDPRINLVLEDYTRFEVYNEKGYLSFDSHKFHQKAGSQRRGFSTFSPYSCYSTESNFLDLELYSDEYDLLLRQQLSPLNRALTLSINNKLCSQKHEYHFSFDDKLLRIVRESCSPLEMIIERRLDNSVSLEHFENEGTCSLVLPSSPKLSVSPHYKIDKSGPNHLYL